MAYQQQIDIHHPIDKNGRVGGANYFQDPDTLSWVPWDSSTKQRVWNPDTLQWEAMVQPSGAGGGTAEYVKLKNIAGTTINPATEDTLVTRATEDTARNILGFQIPYYDEIALTYVVAGDGAGEIATVTYKRATVTQATLTLGYDGMNRLINVART